ncbi:MAG: hypothetical protein RLZZ175_2372 [Bacteroidota bacterium]|jgi:hypothetical protein
MKKLFITISAITLLNVFAFAQREQESKPVRCVSHELLEKEYEQNPQLRHEHNLHEFELQKRINANKHSRSNATIYYIPVVIHIVYNTASQNVSDATIQSQLDVLNKDYRKLNANFNSTATPFKAIAEDAMIQFVLAKRDPSGKTTSGITRTQSNKTSFSPDLNDVKKTSTGGKDPWDPSKYLNIWVCPIEGSILGYAQFPNTKTPATDGVVITTKAFGNKTSNTSPPFDLGRTATHEVGHYLNLKHIWGDSNCGDDNVSDTPPAQASNSGCPSFPHIRCSSTDANGENFNNFMDYSDDACMTMFTKGQVARMRTSLSTTRASLLTSNGIDPVLIQNDLSIKLSNYKATTCEETNINKFKLTNKGSNTITSFQLGITLNNQTLPTYKWNGNLSVGDSIDINIPSINLKGGVNTILAYIQKVNLLNDGNNSNDTIEYTIKYLNQSILPFVDNFDQTLNSNFWKISSELNSINWTRTTTSKKSGLSAYTVANYNATNAGIGKKSTLETNNYFITPQSNFNLDYAYNTLNDNGITYSDTLEISISTNCGQSFQSIFKKGGSQLITATSSNTIRFKPTLNEWSNIQLDLSAFQNKEAIFRITNISGYGNDLFIDNLNIKSDFITGVDTQTHENDIAVFPNPSNGKIQITGNYDKEIEVYDLVGKLITKTKVISNEIDLTYLKSGIYLLKINNQTIKIIIE